MKWVRVGGGAGSLAAPAATRERISGVSQEVLFELLLLLFVNSQAHNNPAQRVSLQSAALFGRKALCLVRCGPRLGDGGLPAPSRGSHPSFREESSPGTGVLKVITIRNELTAQFIYGTNVLSYRALFNSL